MMGHVLLDLEASGGIAGAERRNRANAAALYGCVDRNSELSLAFAARSASTVTAAQAASGFRCATP